MELAGAGLHIVDDGIHEARMATRREAIGLGVGVLTAALAAPRRLLALDPDDRLGAHLSNHDIAIKAARWIARARIVTEDGVTWPANPLVPESVGTDLYNGMPGVVLFHLELFHATQESRWLDEARGGARYLATTLPAMGSSGDLGLYTGLAGAAWVLEEVHRASGDGQFREAAVRAINMIHARVETTGSGIAWTGNSAANDIISGAAGIGLFLLWSDAHMQLPRSRELAESAGRRLLEVGQPSNGGMKWSVAPEVKNLYPNFSHGTAGVGYFLARLHELTGDRAFLDGATAAARYLTIVANSDRKGFKVFHHEPGGEDLYYLSWCHGPAGTSRLFHRLAETTRDSSALDIVRRGARATIDSGIPEQRTPGFWNNISQCCGNCGVGEYFLWLQRVMPSADYAGMIRRIADDTLRRSTPEADGLKWIQAENRVSPGNVVAQTGWMQGAAGVGAFFLHLDAHAIGRKPAIVWPDAI